MFPGVHYTCIVIECWVVDTDLDGFPGLSCNLLGVLVYHSEMGNVGSRMVIKLKMSINCTSCINTVFLYSIFWPPTGFINVELITFFQGRTIPALYVV